MFAYILHVYNDKKSNKKLMLNLNFTNLFGFGSMFIFNLINTCVILP